MRPPRPRTRSVFAAAALFASIAATTSACGSGTSGPDAGPGTPVTPPSTTAPPVTTPAIVTPAGSAATAVRAAVFAAPDGSFLCQIDSGAAAGTTADAFCSVPPKVKPPSAALAACHETTVNHLSLLGAGNAPGWACGGDVPVVPTKAMTAWARQAGATSVTTSFGRVPVLAVGTTLAAGSLRCSGTAQGALCSGPTGSFVVGSTEVRFTAAP